MIDIHPETPFVALRQASFVAPQIITQKGVSSSRRFVSDLQDIDGQEFTSGYEATIV